MDANMTNLSDEQPNAMPAGVAAEFPVIEFYQWDWIPGFAAYLAPEEGLNKDARAFCVLNLGGILCAAAKGDLPKSELAYVIAESMMHEIIHVIEQWAGTEFNEERVEALIEKYAASIRAAQPPTPPASRYIGLEKGEAGKQETE